MLTTFVIRNHNFRIEASIDIDINKNVQKIWQGPNPSVCTDEISAKGRKDKIQKSE